MPNRIPTISEADLQEYEWICDHCNIRVVGPACQGCGAPPPQAMIVIPEDADEDVMERLTSKRRCGNCRNFDLRKGQEMIQNPKDPLYLRLIREMELKCLAQNIPWHLQGLCTEWSGNRGEEFFTNALSPARVNKGRLDSSTPYHEKDHNVPCEAWAPRSQSDGREVKSMRQVKGSRTIGTD